MKKGKGDDGRTNGKWPVRYTNYQPKQRGKWGGLAGRVGTYIEVHSTSRMDWCRGLAVVAAKVPPKTAGT